MFVGVSTGYSQGQLMFGDNIQLQNGWNNYSGGFLDARGYQKDFEKTGNHLCVSTAISNNRDAGSGTWRVVSANGKANGTPVLIGDEVHLQNSWNNNTGGFLDTRGFQKDFAKTGNHLCVSTAISNTRDGGSGTWKIVSAKGKAAGSALANNDEVFFQNSWNNYSGGFLDTRGYQKDFAQTGNHLCVSTASVNNRDGGSGTWKVSIAARNSLNPGEILYPGERLFSTNGQFMLRMQEDDGNLCVYKAVNGKQGDFVWGAHNTNPFTLATGNILIMGPDGNLVIDTKSRTFLWGSYQNKPYNLAPNNSFKGKLILTDAGKLNVVDASGKILWQN